MIMGNTAYSNPIPSSIYHPVVSTNYYFVCNVFNQLFGQAPSALQNISLGGCEVVSQPTDLALLSNQILYNVTTPIPSQLAVISSKIDAASCCSTIGAINSKLDVFQRNESINDGLIISRLGAISASLYDDVIIDQRTESRLIGMDSQLDVIESKLDVNSCCSTIGAINSKLDVFQRTESINDGLIISRLGALAVSLYDDVIIDQRTESRLIGMDSQLDVIESKIDANSCCSTINVMNSKLDVITSVVESFGLACGSTSLTSANISNGAILLSASGNYCLATDLVTTITISGTNVYLDLNQRTLTGVIHITGQNAMVQNGNVAPAGPVAAPAAAVRIISTATKTMLKDVFITCASPTVLNVAGRDGISVEASDVQILDSTITATGAADNTTSTSGPAGGNGITITASRVLVQDCIIQSGSGGRATAGTAGAGGAGVAVSSGTNSKILFCTIAATGAGGTGLGAVGGAGGDGISIASGCTNIEVRNCSISNTGSGGTGSSTGANGKAVKDSVPAASTTRLSKVYSNFAYNIANSVKFDLQATGLEAGVVIPNPPTATVINPYANVYES
jgi:hypothetical protein